MAQYTAAMLDDDATALEMLSAELRAAFSALGHSVVLYPFSDADALTQYLTVRTPDFLFLDIALGRGDGISLGKTLRAMHYDGLILYVSSHSEHVFSALQINPFRFIRKSRLHEELPEAIASGLKLTQEHSGHKILLKNEKAALRVDADKLLYIEAHGKKLELVSTNGTQIFAYRLMDAEQTLQPFGFLRTHKGFLVNFRRIELLTARAAVLEGGLRVPISKYRRAEVESQYLALLRKELAMQGGGFL